MSQSSPLPVPAHRFAVIGGDGRMLHLAERLTEEGCHVSLLGCGNECLPLHSGKGELRICTTLAKAAEDATAVILPLPATRDQKTVSCPRDPACTVSFEELALLLDRHPALTLFGGKLPKQLTEGRSDRVTDYFDDPVLNLRNAYITAEAALMTAMELTDRTLRDTSVAVLGYGRIGKYLARLLLSLGASVTVCARREEVLFEAAAEGCRPLLMTETERETETEDAREACLRPLCRDHAILFNTIPSPVLPRGILIALERDTLLIDLASAPFGVRDEDVQDAAAQNGLRYLRAPSLPGSYAPRDAGRIIAECVLNALATPHPHRDAPDTPTTKGGTPI